MMLTEFSKMVSVDHLMSVNPLPPQAYTKDILQKAYTWLLTQSPAIKEIASSQEMLIGLYLKAQRSGESSLEAPSIQNFKQELKSLAGIMGDLQPSPIASQQSSIHNSGSQAYYHQPVQTAVTAGLDPASLLAISEVKQTLNLSTDTEALRALIALGHKQFKKI